MAGTGNNNNPTTQPGLVDEEGNPLSSSNFLGQLNLNLPQIGFGYTPYTPPNLEASSSAIISGAAAPDDPPTTVPFPISEAGGEFTFTPHTGVGGMFGGGDPEGDTEEGGAQGRSMDMANSPISSGTSLFSNMGVSPLSGSIVWNSISGGFQPLPILKGRSKKLFQLSQFHGGINQKSSPRDLGINECQEAKNVTFSHIGVIKVLGDIKSDASGLSTATLASAATHIPCSGYGLFIFNSAYSLASAPVQENCTIVCSTDGEHVVFKDDASSATTIDDGSSALTISNDAVNVAPVFHAFGNGLYVNDANFAHTTTSKCARLVYREDQRETVTGWVYGNRLIDAPIYDSQAAGSMAVGDVKVKSALEQSTVAGTMIIECTPQSNPAGSWGVDTVNTTYYFYVSWLFDNGCETGLTSCGTESDGDESDGISFQGHSLDFNVNFQHKNDAHLGGNKRIEGARIYFKESGTTEKWLLAEINLKEGVRGALESTFTKFTIGTDKHTLATDINFSAPPSVQSYNSQNLYYANEVYTEVADEIATGTAGPVPHDLRYKTSVVAQNGLVFVGNVEFRGKHFADGMMFSMPGKPGVIPELNFFDSPSGDGSPITALAAFQDTILQFKENAMYIINISNPGFFHAEAIFKDCGVANPCQVFTCGFGVIFANKYGCYIYDGQKVISLTSGKFDISDWGLSESDSIADDNANVPCVGYDPRSQSIIVLKNIGDESDNDDGWVYNMVTQSWTEGVNIITNSDTDRHTNFQIAPNGHLCICQDAEETLKAYSVGNADSNTQSITYITKDIDFGTPSQTKKIMKVYVTYTSGSSNVPDVTYGVNGATPSESFTGSFSTGQTKAVATLIPGSSGTGCNSFAIKITGTVDEAFEINDIAILYRERPVK